MITNTVKNLSESIWILRHIIDTARYLYCSNSSKPSNEYSHSGSPGNQSVIFLIVCYNVSVDWKWCRRSIMFNFLLVHCVQFQVFALQQKSSRGPSRILSHLNSSSPSCDYDVLMMWNSYLIYLVFQILTLLEFTAHGSICTMFYFFIAWNIEESN